MPFTTVRNAVRVIPQEEVVRLYSEGLTTRQISTQINVGVRYMEYKIGEIRAAHGAKTIAQLVGIFKDKKLI